MSPKIKFMIGSIKRTLMKFKSQIITIMKKILHYKNNRQNLKNKDFKKEDHKKLKKEQIL